MVSLASESLIFWFVVPVQLVGLLSVVLARLTEQSSAQLAAQIFFLMALVTVGLTTALTLSTGGGAWLFSATTLPIMAVGATIDLRRGRSQTAF